MTISAAARTRAQVEFRFDSMEHFRSAMSSPEWAKVGADVKNFATGGLTIVASTIA